MIRSRIILLVEDNPNDVKLTIHAFEQSNISNEIVVVGDGENHQENVWISFPTPLR